MSCAKEVTFWSLLKTNSHICLYLSLVNIILRRTRRIYLELDILAKRKTKTATTKSPKLLTSSCFQETRITTTLEHEECEAENILVCTDSGWLLLCYFCFSADIGGTMGLFLGCSLLTLFEFLDLLIMASFSCYSAKKSASKKVNQKSEAYHDSVLWWITCASLRDNLYDSWWGQLDIAKTADCSLCFAFPLID